MPKEILIPSSADFETAQGVHQELRKKTNKLKKTEAYIIDFDAADPSLLSLQLAASCIATLATAGCGYELTGHAKEVLGTERVQLS